MNQNHISWMGNSGLNPNPNTPREPAVPAMAPAVPSPAALPFAPTPPDFMQPRYPLEPVRTDMPRNITGRNDTMDAEPDMMAPTRQGPPPLTERGYIPYYLSTIIGKNVRAEFVIGAGSMMDKTGVLREVGINYFVLEDYVSHARIMCDLYSVKFVTTL